jgi:hypothetical protein
VKDFTPLSLFADIPNEAYPGAPTIAESGVPGFGVSGAYGVIGPARLPGEVAATAANIAAQ